MVILYKRHTVYMVILGKLATWWIMFFFLGYTDVFPYNNRCQQNRSESVKLSSWVVCVLIDLRDDDITKRNTFSLSLSLSAESNRSDTYLQTPFPTWTAWIVRDLLRRRHKQSLFLSPSHTFKSQSFPCRANAMSLGNSI